MKVPKTVLVLWKAKANMLVYPLLQCLQHPLPVFTGKCSTRYLRTSKGRYAHLLDGLFWAFRGFPDVTFCVAGPPLPEDGHPLFGVLCSPRWERMLAVPKTVEDDGLPEDVHVPAMGFDGELIFGCKWVWQIHISHLLVVGTNNARLLNLNVDLVGFVPA